MNIEKIIRNKIIAFIPIYIEARGNGMLVHTAEGGEVEMEKNIKSLLRLMAKYYLLDLEELKKRHREILGIKNLLPLAFGEGDIFIALKTRVPLCKNDGAIGYINLSYIEGMEEIEKNKSRVKLRGGKEIMVLNSLSTAKRHLKNGEIIRKISKKKEILNPYDHIFYKEYSSPATKADIALLIKEILAIKETIR